MLALGTLALPLEASANIFIPSFVQMISAPLAYSFFIVPIPLIYIIAFIEALVLRQHVKGASIWQLTGKLSVINAITASLVW